MSYCARCYVEGRPTTIQFTANIVHSTLNLSFLCIEFLKIDINVKLMIASMGEGKEMGKRKAECSAG